MITVVDSVNNHGRENREEGEGGGTLRGWMNEVDVSLLWLCLAALLFLQDVCPIPVPGQME